MFAAKYPGTAVDAAFFTALNTALTGSTFLLASELAAFQAVASTYSLNRAQAATYFTAVILSTDPTSLGLSTTANPANPNGLSDAQTYINQFNAATNRTLVSGNFANQSATASNLNYPVVGPATNAGYLGGVNAESGVNNLSASVVTAENSITIAAAANDPALIPNVPQPGTTFQLTTGVDAPGLGAFAFGSPAGNSTVFGSWNGGTPTYTPGDNIQATGANNTFNLTDNSVGGVGNVNSVAATVSGVQTLNVTSGEAVAANTATGTGGFTGLTNLTVSGVSNGATAATVQANVITAAATTDVSLTDNSTSTGRANADGAGTTLLTNINGGRNIIANVNLGAALFTAAGLVDAINVGQTTAATGTVTVTETVSSALTGAWTAATINVTGGTAVKVTANLAETAGAGNTVTGGAINVTGTAATTTVTVNQTAAATAAAAVAAQTGSVARTAVTAGPGVQAVTATSAVTAQTAKAAVAGVVDGAVTIVDANYNTTNTNTITSVTLGNFGNGSVIRSNALANLNLTGGTGTLTITNATNGAGGVPTSNATLAVSLNGVGSKSSTTGTVTNVTLVDTNNELTTLNLTTATKDSYLTITDTGLQNITVAGTNKLTLSTVPTTVKTIAVSGSASFDDNGTLVNDAALTSFTTTSTGNIKAYLNAQTTSFAGGAGSDIITINADATKAISGGTGVNEIIFNNTAATFNATSAKLTNANVTGFTVFGVGAGSGNNQVWNLSNFNSGFNVIDVTSGFFGTGNNVTFNNVAQNSGIVIRGTDTGLTVGNTYASAGTVAVNYFDTSGATDSVNVRFGAEYGVNYQLARLDAADANGIGIGNLTFTTLNSDIGNAGGAQNTITTLGDNQLSSLTVNGSGGLTITGFAAANNATSLSIASNQTGQNGTTITTYNGPTLGNLSISGTNSTTIGAFTAPTVASFSVTNSGTGTVNLATTTAFADANLNRLTLTNNVGFNVGTLGILSGAGTATGATTGVTVGAGTDNSQVNLWLTGAAAGQTDTITLGNANNFIRDTANAGAGTVNATVGTGQNYIYLGADTTGNTTGTYAITAGAHTAANEYVVGTAGNNVTTAANFVITGAAVGDQIVFAADTLSSNAALTATSLTGAGSVAQAIQVLETAAIALGAHGVAYGVYGGNTYLVQDLDAGTATATTTTVVQLNGSYSLTASTGYVTVGSLASNLPTVTNTLTAGQTFTGLTGLNYNITGIAGAAQTFNLTVGTAGTATVNFAANDAGATINVSGSTTAGNVLTGGSAGDTITGGTSTDTITGNAGVDTMTGNGGLDTFTFANNTVGIVVAGAATTLTGTDDRITDFVGNGAAAGDTISLGTGAAAFGTGITFTGATTTTVTTITVALTGLANWTAVTAALQTAVAGTASTSAAAQIYDVTLTAGGGGDFNGGVAARVAIVNNDVAAIGASDAVINLTGITGALNAQDFVYA